MPNLRTRTLLAAIITLLVVVVAYALRPYLFSAIAQPIGIERSTFEGFMAGSVFGMALAVFWLTWVWPNEVSAWLTATGNGYVSLLLLAGLLAIILLPVFWQLASLVAAAMGSGLMILTMVFVLLLILSGIAYLKRS